MIDHLPSFVVLGAGGRGQYFASWLRQHPEAGRVVAVAEPHPERRRRLVTEHGISPEMVFARWEDLMARPRLGDIVLNTLMDRLHAASAIQVMQRGYHMLLEKPMATTIPECAAINQAWRQTRCVVSICHSLRYHGVYAEIKRLLQQGAIGQVISVDQLEGVEPVHQSHSFVRGNWGNESRSTFMLMSKSCHDLDVLAYLVDRPCRRVSSFGSLSYFTRSNAPPGAPARCTDGCPAESSCPYSAYKVYLPQDSSWAWHADLGDTAAQRIEALKSSPYGRCVFQCDNDAVDHQVVNMEFDGGATGTFTMTAFAPGGRHVRIHGTHGMLVGDVAANAIDLYRLSDSQHEHIQVACRAGGHGGADGAVMENLVRAVRANDPSLVLTNPSESLATHAIVFAAERSRREGRVVALSEVLDPSQD